MSETSGTPTIVTAHAYADLNTAGRSRRPGINVDSETETPEDLVFADLASYDGPVGPTDSANIDAAVADAALESLGFRRIADWHASPNSENMPASGQWHCEVERI